MSDNEKIQQFMNEFTAFFAEKTAGEVCDDCGKEVPTFEVAGKRLCAVCIAPPQEAMQNGVTFEGTRVFAIIDGKALEIQQGD